MNPAHTKMNAAATARIIAKADEHIEKLKEFRPVGFGHQERDKDWSEQRAHTIQDECAAIDHE